MKDNTKHVIVIGGGFAGINLIKHLGKDKRFIITLVDRNNYHFFPPLIYQVAAAFIEPSNISYPFRRLFQEKPHIRFHMGELKRIDPRAREVETTTGTLSYDYLVLAMGTGTNYFGFENIAKFAVPMKTLDDAMNLRNHILLRMECAVRAIDPAERDKALNIVIAGGGPTGVELAGILAEMGREIVAKEYPELTDFHAHLYLVNSAPVLLPPMSTKAQREAYTVLKKLGAKIVLNTKVVDYASGNVMLSSGEAIPTDTLIWTSGVVAVRVEGLPGDAVARGGRISVDAFNRVAHTESIFALGDQCVMTDDENYPEGHPQVAQVAIQQGKLLGKNLSRMADGKPMRPFLYRDKGTMAIISKYRAVADLPKGFLRGWIAWVSWLFVHIIPLISFRNKVVLATNWAWSFVTNDPTLRLILRPSKEQKQPSTEDSKQ
ncbi:NAD(P)/FAD-dependent oxidoreductase [Parapedobacter sp. ISTM3]|uniref:NAD(P)/FAD-dependent oxidoreductase n=1 Tax=Parapedobacter sp. ISTM3 TaxID=2800130 RepID=UPI001908111C|nr:NAD(P)/FAD-dependent oxidoreductase [Parapedobacter sp. ISTM3]MBK1441870.1 NAD(P)/FAD-dependent oxidoreductase [Parapedobacter sp. ISTM3]